MASKAQPGIREVSVRLINKGSYVLFWIAIIGGALVWLTAMSNIASVFGIGRAFIGSLSVLIGWLGAIAITGILVILVEILRSRNSRK